jgi:inosine-uridine nucleoside N-ribohydrolase
MNHSLKYRVIFDTDPGVDDAMALCFAMAHPRIDLVGITTTFGNVKVTQASANWLAARLQQRKAPASRLPNLHTRRLISFMAQTAWVTWLGAMQPTAQSSIRAAQHNSWWTWHALILAKSHSFLWAH